MEKKMKVHSESQRHWKNCPQFVPYSLLNEEWANRNHDQTLDRLNERGGMGCMELLDNINNRRLSMRNETQQDADDLAKIVNQIMEKKTAEDNREKPEEIIKKLIWDTDKNCIIHPLWYEIIIEVTEKYINQIQSPASKEYFNCPECGEKIGYGLNETTRDVWMKSKLLAFPSNQSPEDNREGKPDFEKLSEEIVKLTECDDQQTSVYQDGVIAGAEKIWNDYVTPLQSRIKELEDQQRWIPIEEREPEDAKPVLGYMGPVIGSFEVVYWYGGVWYYCSDDKRCHLLKFWQPLPKSPPTPL